MERELTNYVCARSLMWGSIRSKIFIGLAFSCVITMRASADDYSRDTIERATVLGAAVALAGVDANG